MDQVCDAYVDGADTSCTVQAPNRLPGDLASDGGQCFSGMLIDNVCAGKNLGEACNNTVQQACDPRYYCGNSGTCETRTLKMGKNCAGHFDGCPFFSKCYTPDQVTYTCTQYFTLDDGAKVANGDQILCKNYYIDSATNQCAEAPKFSKTDRKTKTAHETCIYTLGGKDWHDVSRCGYNSNTFSYCPVMGGDITEEDRSNFQTVADAYLNCSNKHHEYARFGFECKDLYQSIDKRFRNAAKMIFYLQDPNHYGMVQDNPDCIKNGSIPEVNLFHDFIAEDVTKSQKETSFLS